MSDEDLSAFGGPGRVTSDPRGRDQRNTPTSTTSTANVDPDATDPRGRNQQNTPVTRRTQNSTSTPSTSLRSASSKVSSVTGGNGPVENFMNKVTMGTYKFTLYIVDADVFNDPRQYLGVSDEPALVAGKACIISESGVEGAYMMENVVIVGTAAANGKGNADVTMIEFDIMEPLGFSLLDRMLTVGKELDRGNSSGLNFTSLNYVIKLEFLGRDPVSGATKKYEESFLYKGKMNDVNGSIGPGGTNYHVIFAPEEMVALSNAQQQTSVTVRNVKDVASFATNLENALNDNQRSLMVAGQTKPLIEWKIRLGDRINISARENHHMSIPSFDLSTAPWGGTADSSTSGGQSVMLETLDQGRQITLNSQSQLVAYIQTSVSNNTPSFAEWQINARKQGISESITVILNNRDLGERDPVFNIPREEVTITINLRTDPSITPLEPENVAALRNQRATQEARFDSEILPHVIKKYSYIYTGENTEVIDIELNLNQIFHNAQAPAAGIYYANNHNQFEPNLIPKDTQPTGTNNQTASAASSQSRASARYLSDIQLNKYNLLQSTVFNTVQSGTQTQQRNETTLTDTIAAAAIEEYARRIADSQTMEIQVRGDPIFLGQTGSGNNIWDGSASSVFAAFLSYQPDVEDLLNDQRRGPVDMISSGIYIITNVESKFQNGSFTQRIKLIKDNNSTTFLLLQKIIEMEPK